ncbi:MAG: cupin domain-containing protein [Bryobacterales bacterium]
MPGVRVKRLSEDGVHLRLVEMLSTAEHPEWCEVGHAGCVVEGELEIEFEDRVVRYKAGDAILIPPGSAEPHRPKALTDPVRLVLVDYADRDG